MRTSPVLICTVLLGCTSNMVPSPLAEDLGLPLTITPTTATDVPPGLGCMAYEETRVMACYLNNRQVSCERLAADANSYASDECVRPARADSRGGIMAECYQEFPLPVVIAVSVDVRLSRVEGLDAPRRGTVSSAYATCCAKGASQIPRFAPCTPKGSRGTPWSSGTSQLASKDALLGPGDIPPSYLSLRRYRHFIVEVNQLSEEDRSKLAAPPPQWVGEEGER